MEAVAKASCKPYQVFINHRGPDTKKNIASLIYHALERYGLPVFLDQYVLCPGDSIKNEIEGAISSSSVHIAIFSKNYAQSRWCLDELCWMLKSSHQPKLIPIFCDVEPWELRHTEKGCYADAFRKHEERASTDVVKGWKDALKEASTRKRKQHSERESMEVVDEWKKALGKAADISGTVFKWKETLRSEAADISGTRVFIVKESDDYGKLVKNIEDTVMEHVIPDPLEVAPHPVGLKQAWTDLRDRLKQQSSTKVVVIAGLGGIGKSTLATYIFNDLRRSEFTRASFLFSVRETVDLTSLQRQLSRDLVGIDKRISNANEGKSMLQNSLKGLKILIVFDDVDDRDKIDSVLDVHAVEPGSLIFVTSRDKDVLRGSYKTTSFVYDVEPLKSNHAQTLFCHHAFHDLNPPEGYGDLVEEFLKFCGGLPLCLQVLGEQLSSNSDRKHWERQLKLYFQGASLPEADAVIKKLKWSCKDMRSEEQRMLLDVAYFFGEEDLELAVQVLEGLEYLEHARYYLGRLCKTYLISFKNDVDSRDEAVSQLLRKRSPKIIMHNQVKEMARCIAREDSREPLRLSCAVDIEKLVPVQSGSVSRCIRGISIRKDQSPREFPVMIDMRGINILIVEHPIDPSWFLRLSGELVWLRWHSSPFIPLPRTISLRNLRVLELQGDQDDHRELFFSSIDEIPSELRVLDIDFPQDPQWYQGSSSISTTSKRVAPNLPNLPSFPRFLQSIGSLMENLTKIVLKYVIDADSLPFNFSGLKHLKHLDLSGSTYLTTLPDSFSQLLQLQHLALRDCRNLSIPEHILGEISTLEHIDFEGCAQLLQLPQGITSQRRLRYLNLLETSLLELPSNLEPLCRLEQLIIASNSLKELPSSVASLRNLKELLLLGCSKLEHISIPIERLTSLERLEISGSKVTILPAGISLLKHLRVLTISCPIKFVSLDNNVMDALTHLTLCGTSISAITIPAGACPMLEIVDLSDNCRLRQVQLSQSTIVKLNLDGCENLQDLNLANLGRLKFLDIKRCGNVAIESVAECRSLEEIRAEKCRLAIAATWSELERLNFFEFSQEFHSFCMWRWRKYRNRMMAVMVINLIIKKDFENLLNSFHGVTLREVPSTVTDESPLLLEKVHSHSAILMCFITNHDFFVSFEACNGGGRSEEFEIRGSVPEWVNVYMWTQRSTLFTDEDNFYDNVSIYGMGGVDVEGSGRGWILTFSSERHALHVLNQIMNHPRC